jgi:type VI secretion system secreted protein Hcp
MRRALLSAAQGYANQIDVLAWSSGFSKQANTKLPNFQSMSSTKYFDRSSPAILQDVASGATFPSAKLHIVKAGEGQLEYITLCFTGVRFESSSTGGSGGEDRLTENVSFSYQTIVEKYKQQNAAGDVTNTIFGGWDLVRNLQLGGPCT